MFHIKRRPQRTSTDKTTSFFAERFERRKVGKEVEKATFLKMSSTEEANDKKRKRRRIRKRKKISKFGRRVKNVINVGRLAPNKRRNYLKSKFGNKSNLATLFSKTKKSPSISHQSTDSFEPPVTSALLDTFERQKSFESFGKESKTSSLLKTYQLNGKHYSNISHLFSKRKKKKRDFPTITLKYLKEKLILDAEIHINNPSYNF